MSIASIVRATLDDFASLLRVPNDAAEDAIKSERGAKAVISRRNLFAAAGALTTGALISVPEPVSPEVFIYTMSAQIGALVDVTRVGAWRAAAFGQPEDGYIRWSLVEKIP